jgi:hypothetical protein
MVRRPQSGDGTRSPVYYLNSAGLLPPRSRALCGQTDPSAAGMRADGSPAAPGLGGSWQRVGDLRLGVPVAASGGGGVVAGEPAWLSAPPHVSPPPAAQHGTDQVAQSQLLNELPAFFRSYASSDSAALNRFAVRGAPLTGLGDAVTFDSIGALHVPPGGATRQITVTVIWQLPELPGSNASRNPEMTTTLKMTYGMSVIDLQSDKWYVKEIGASTEAVGAR